jgi:hypothetical protein
VVCRHKKAVAKIIPVTGKVGSRIGPLAGPKDRMGAGFDHPAKNPALADDFGVPRR